MGAAVLVGAFTVGVGSRLAMALLARLNPDATGVISDDGFEMGRFTFAGSVNLLVVGLVLGLISGLLYLLLEPLCFGPWWFRALSLSVGAGTVAATQLVHSDGVDFRLLEPLRLAVGLFVAIPVLHVAVVTYCAAGIRAATGTRPRVLRGPVAWVLRGGLAVWFVLAVASLAGDVQDLAPIAG